MISRSGDQWAARRVRNARLALIAALVIGTGALSISAPPTIRKLRASRWPSTTAFVRQATEHRASWKARLVFGRQVDMTFDYYANGPRLTAQQTVSGAYATSIRLPTHGTGNLATPSHWNRPKMVAYFDPAAPANAVLERELSRDDLVTAIECVLIVAAFVIFGRVCREAAAARSDPQKLTVLRNAGAWQTIPPASDGSLTATPLTKTTTASVVTSWITGAWPVAAMRFDSYPVNPGTTIDLHVTFGPDASTRSLSITFAAGSFTTRATDADATWTRRVWHGTPEPGTTIDLRFDVPMPSDLPTPDCSDFWLVFALDGDKRQHARRVFWLSVVT